MDRPDTYPASANTIDRRGPLASKPLGQAAWLSCYRPLAAIDGAITSNQSSQLATTMIEGLSRMQQPGQELALPNQVLPHPNARSRQRSRGPLRPHRGPAPPPLSPSRGRRHSIGLVQGTTSTTSPIDSDRSIALQLTQ